VNGKKVARRIYFFEEEKSETKKTTFLSPLFSLYNPSLHYIYRMR
jgi:hypothetical protein